MAQGELPPEIANVLSSSGLTSGFTNNMLFSTVGQNALDQYKSGDIDALELQRIWASQGINLSPAMTQWLNNMIEKESADRANKFQLDYRDTSTLSQASQLSQLGLSPNNVLSAGSPAGTHANMAGVDKSNPALEKQKMNYQLGSSIAGNLLSTLGRLGGAGIYGSTYAAVRNAASNAADYVSRSANSILTHSKYKNDKERDKDWNYIYKMLGV